MSNPNPARASTPTQAKILEILAQADYRDVLRISREDTDTLRADLACQALGAQAFSEAVRAWLGRAWIIDVGIILIDAPETSALRE